MFKFIGKALAGAVLTKDSREAIEKLAQAKKDALLPPFPTAGTIGQELAPGVAADKALEAALTPGKRAALIRDAMRIRAAKQGVLDELSDEERAKLALVAAKAFGTSEPEQK